MRGNVLEMLFFGLISGVAEVLPISAPAHQFLLSYFCGFDGHDPLLLLCVHSAVLLALIISCRQKIAHLYRENRIASIKRGRRKRQPDMAAVADWKLLTAALVPIIVGLLLHNALSEKLESLWILSILLVINGIMLYIPQYMDIGNRDARHLSRVDGLTMGALAAIGVLPGISRITAILLLGKIRRGNRAYILDAALLLSIFWLVGLIVLDIVSAFGVAIAQIQMAHTIGYLLAAVAAFGGAFGSVALARYLAVRIGFSSFTYYCWGLGFVCFILYLMI